MTAGHLKASALILASGWSYFSLAQTPNQSHDQSPFHAPAQISYLRLEDVLSSVDSFFPAIQRAEAELERQREIANAARGPFDPKLSAEWSRKRGYPENEVRGVKIDGQIPYTGIKAEIGFDEADGTFPAYDGDQATGSDGRYKAKVTVPLLRDLVIDRARASVRLQTIRAAESLERARLVRIDTYAKAALAYWEWQVKSERLEIANNLLELAKKRDEIISKRIRRGDSAGIEGLDNQRMILQREANLFKAEQDLVEAELKVSLFLRTSNEEMRVPQRSEAPKWLIKEKADKIDFTAPPVDKILAEFPNIQRLRAKAEQMRVSRRLAFSNLLPQLDFRLEQSRYQGLFPGSRNNESELFAGFAFSIPIFNMQARGEKRAADFDLKATEQELLLAEQELRLQLNQMYAELQALHKIFLRNYAEALVTERLERAERLKFQSGDSNLFIVNLREMDTAQARLKAVNSLLEFQKTDLDLKLLSNTWLRTY